VVLDNKMTGVFGTALQDGMKSNPASRGKLKSRTSKCRRYSIKFG
jgi:hypothetical protein